MALEFNIQKTSFKKTVDQIIQTKNKEAAKDIIKNIQQYIWHLEDRLG